MSAIPEEVRDFGKVGGADLGLLALGLCALLEHIGLLAHAISLLISTSGYSQNPVMIDINYRNPRMVVGLGATVQSMATMGKVIMAAAFFNMLSGLAMYTFLTRRRGFDARGALLWTLLAMIAAPLFALRLIPNVSGLVAPLLFAGALLTPYVLIAVLAKKPRFRSHHG